jgi:hypothetical protein
MASSRQRLGVGSSGCWSAAATAAIGGGAVAGAEASPRWTRTGRRGRGLRGPTLTSASSPSPRRPAAQASLSSQVAGGALAAFGIGVGGYVAGGTTRSQGAIDTIRYLIARPVCTGEQDA